MLLYRFLFMPRPTEKPYADQLCSVLMCAVKQKRLATFSLARGRPHIQELFEEALLNPLTGSSHSAWVRGVHELLLMAFLAYSAAFAYNSGSSWAVALSM